MTTLLLIVLPVFLLIGGGYLARKFGVVESSWIHVLNSYVYAVALPALIATSFWKMEWRASGAMAALGFSAGATLIFAALLVLFLDMLKLKPSLRAEIFLAALVGNTIYMGFPIGERAFGSEGFYAIAAAAAVQLVLGLVLAVVMAEHWVLKTRAWNQYLKDFARNPLIWSLVLGLALSLWGTDGWLAQMFFKAAEMLAATASPVALFALGAFLYGRYSKEHDGYAILAGSLKLIAFPAVVLLLAIWLNLEGYAYKSSMLLAGMPTAATAFVIAEKFKLDKNFIAHAILLGTAASVLTISLLILIVGI